MEIDHEVNRQFSRESFIQLNGALRTIFAIRFALFAFFLFTSGFLSLPLVTSNPISLDRAEILFVRIMMSAMIFGLVDLFFLFLHSDAAGAIARIKEEAGEACRFALGDSLSVAVFPILYGIFVLLAVGMATWIALA